MPQDSGIEAYADPYGRQRVNITPSQIQQAPTSEIEAYADPEGKQRIGGPMSPAKEPTWGQWAISNILSTGPALAGGAAGSLLGPWGTIGGGAAGSALGSHFRQLYEQSQGLRDEYNPWLTGVEGAVGAIPIGGALPKVGSGIKGLVKYMGRGAAEGAALGTAATYPMSIVETGQIPTFPQAVKSGISGAPMGAVMAGAFGVTPAFMKGPRPLANHTDPNLQQPSMDLGQPIPRRPTGPGQQELPIEDLGKSVLGGQEAFKGMPANSEATLRALGLSDEQIAKLSPQQKWDFSQHEDTTFPGMPSTDMGAGPARSKTPGQDWEVPAEAWRTPPPEAPVEAESTEGKRIISKPNWTSPEIKLLENQGWVRGGVVSGFATMYHPADFPNGPPKTVSRAVPQQKQQPAKAGFPALPRDLAGGRPHYGEYELEFDNDIDKALYIIAQDKPSKRDSDYLKYVLEHVEVDEAEAREMGQEVRGIIADRVRGLPKGVVKLERIASIADEIPVSKEGVPFNEDEDITIKNPSKSVIDRMEKQGYTLTHMTSEGESVFSRATDEEGPLFQREKRPYDPRIGQDALQRGMGNFENALKNSSDDELVVMKKTLQDDLQRLTDEATMYPTGMTKRRVGLAKDKLDTVEAELSGRQGPLLAKVEGGGLKADVHVARSIVNITKDYTSPLPKIMAREGMQNALDAVKLLGKNGVIKVRMNQDTGVLEVYDNGSGMDETTLAEKLVRIFSTGKEGQEGAVGGKGIGSASYLFGGKFAEIDTVAVDSIDGKKYRIIAGGTPERFNSEMGSSWEKTQVPDSTPTYTKMKVELTDEQSKYHPNQMMDFVLAHSRDKGTKVIYDPYGYGSIGRDVSEIKADNAYITEHTFKESKSDKLVDFFETPTAKVDVKVPDFDETVERRGVEVHYLNDGMYQFSETLNADTKAKGIPEHVLVDITSKVDEQATDYPYINTREDIKKDLRELINTRLREKITGPAVEKRKNRTQELYDSMSTVGISGTMRKPVVFDPGNRLTATELKTMVNSPLTQELVQHYDMVLDAILAKVGRVKWMERLEGVGIVLDPGMHGVMIPNPNTKKATILFNPFLRVELGQIPADAAWNGTITQLHEVAHLGIEAGITGTDRVRVDMSQFISNDPRMSKWQQSLVDQIVSHGDVGWTNTGHGVDFIHRLSETYASFGMENTYAAAAKLESILTRGSKAGGYSPEVQKLLLIYSKSRRRDAVTEDLLSGTGVKSASTGTGQGSLPGIGQNDGGGTPPIPPTEPTGATSGGSNRRVKLTVPGGKKKPSALQEWYNLPRGATTTMDLSAPLRQGLPLIFSKNFWKSWKQMLTSFGSEEAYRRHLDALKSRELFQRLKDPNTGEPITGPKGASFAERVGMKLSEVGGDLTAREEATASNWVETGGFLKKLGPGVQGAYAGTLGKYARASNRAYTAFLNQLRADTFEALLKDAKGDFDAGTKGSRNPMEDLVFAREIADFVNTATGRGPLKGSFIGEKEHSLEQNAKFLTNTIFSPRLMASRARMLSPGTYVMASPFVRKQYVKALLSVAGAWGSIAALAAGAGADIESDMDSADWGKIRIGNTRLDPGAGFQQYLVTAHRLLISGRTTSSASGLSRELGQGYQATTRRDVLDRFATNKLHPVLKFANDLLDASQYQPFNVGDRTVQMFVPLVVQDVLELAKEDPKLLPLMIPIASGMGTQTYEKGTTGGKLVPAEKDWVITGGAPENEIPNLWE